VTKNLSHSCVKSTLADLFARARPNVLVLARRYVAILRSLGDVQVLVQKTRLVAVARVRFAGLEPRKDHFIANFALHRWVRTPRIVRNVDYGPRWRRHELRIESRDDLDDELRAWLQESHDVVGLQTSLRPQGSSARRR
jgi:hypothetical protein